jgi:hypothetical protein
MDVAAELTELFAGRCLLKVTRREHDWAFDFSAASEISLVGSGPWRVLDTKRSRGQIAFTSDDDGQQFGLPTPLDAAKELERLINDMVVSHASIREETGDFTVHFSRGINLELLTMSSGYESWQIYTPEATIVVTGGGKVVSVST